MRPIRHWRMAFVLAAGGLLALVMIILASQPGRAAGPWYVSPDGDDSNSCTSPGAACATINGARAKATSGDTIYVAIGTYTGYGDQVVLLTKSITLSGGWDTGFTTQSGTSTIDGQGSRRGLTVNSGVTAVVERFTVQNGSAEWGGGIRNDGTLTLNYCIVSDNTAEAGGGVRHWGGYWLTLNHSLVSGNTATEGGGIANWAGTVTLNHSIVSGNAADEGGGIHNRYTLTLNSSTVSGNYGAHGGGIRTGRVAGGVANLNNSTISGNTAVDGGGVSNVGTLILTNSTVSDNTAENTAGGISGGGTVKNSIVAGNTAGGTSPDCSGTLASSGHNLVGDTSGCTFTPRTGDLTNVNPNLGLLVGAPGYHPLLPGSPAIDAGNPTGCTDYQGNPLDTDQRGASRVGRCDMGAYEHTTAGAAASISALVGTPQRTPPFSTFWAPLQAAVLDSIGTPVSDTVVTLFAPVSGPSGTFSQSGTFTRTALTNEGGVTPAATFTANGLKGSYVVTATAAGLGPTASFLLNNTGWYVASGGSDASACQSAATPCATINGALNKPGFLVGDTVLVAGGTYTGDDAQAVLLDQSVRLVRLLGGWNDSFTRQHGTSSIDGEGLRRGITVESGVTATVERFTVQNGSGGDYGIRGAGVANDGTLTLNDCVVSGNSTTGNGGGIDNSKGALTLNGCTVSGNTASEGGGISNGSGTVILNDGAIRGNTAYSGGGISNGSGTVMAARTYIGQNSGNKRGGGIHNSGTVTLINSTIGDNTTYSTGYCYQCFRGGGIYNSGAVDLYNSTVVRNKATGEQCNPYCEGGGIYNMDGEVAMQNTILAGNTADSYGPDCKGSVNSAGYNVVGNTSDCGFSSTTGDLLDVDAGLVTLWDHLGYYPLWPDSPAIDAGNPAGCTDHEGNPLTTDQRGSPRPLDGDGDGDAICDVGAYEFDPDHPISQVFLPTCIRNFCSDFFDGFSDPASGWAIVDDPYVRTEYLLGEYRVLSKQAGYFYLFSAPTCDRRSYVVEADARWVGSPGSSYGLIFGVTSGFEQYYLFDMNTDYKLFRLLRRDSSGLTVVVPVTESSAINGGKASNYLKVTRDGDQITLEVNGTVLGTWTEGTITGFTGSGLVSSPYSSEPVSDARFDNFRVTRIPDGTAVGVPAPAPAGAGVPKVHRQAVPVGMEYR